MGSSRWVDPSELADALVAGARRELDLTPKPGLVDRRDNGSHPDLTYDAMSRSIGLLPIYFDELIAHAAPGSLDACIRAGRDAEARMHAAIGTNAHKGYIFLSGVILLAACAGPSDTADLRVSIAEIARRFFERTRPEGKGGGIRAETLAGLPSIFEIGMPGYAERLRATDDPRVAAVDLMARLMIHLEDTTALRRCGPEGLETLRADGAQILRTLDAGEDPTAHLAGLNDDYRRRNLTMGGVADCMAAAFALLEVLPAEGSRP